MVRATWPWLRSRAATRSDNRRSSRTMPARCAVSTGNVSSAPMLRSTAGGLTARSSWPCASADSCAAAAWPSANWSVASGVFAISPIVRRPRRCRIASVRSPTPHSAAVGSGCKKVRTPWAGTSSSPSGLHRADAILATNIDGATPTEQVSCSCEATLARMAAATRTGDPRRRRAPVTSRNASSRDSGWTIGVTSRKIAMIAADARR